MLFRSLLFITEEIFCNLNETQESIMISDWPVYKAELSFAKEEASVELLKEDPFLVNLTQNETLKYKILSFNTLFLQCFRILL